MIEVELRGPLKEKREELIAHAVKHGTLLGELNQIAIFCDTWDERLGNFYDPKVRVAFQLSYDVHTKQQSLHLKVKNGHWANVGRQEVVLHLRPEELPRAYQLLNTFGITSGCPRFYHRIDYQIGDITLSLKEDGLAPDHWEVEIAVEKNDEAKAHKQLQAFLKNLGFMPWTEEEYKTIINKVYRENPPVEFGKIDVSRVWRENSNQ